MSDTFSLGRCVFIGVGRVKKAAVENRKGLEKDPASGDSVPRIPKVIACVPVYMDEDHIAKIVVGVRKYVDGVIVCDDASTDSTFDIVESLGVIAIKHDTSLGYNSTMITLYKNAIKSDADFILTFDGDNRYDMNDIPLLIDRVIKGDVDIVVGSRYLGDASRAVGKKTGSLTYGGVTLTDPQSSFRVFTRKVLDNIELTGEPIDSSAFITKAISKGLKVVEVPVQAKDGGASKPPVAEVSREIGGLKDFVLLHPLLLFGVPSLLAVLVGLGVWGMALLWYFNSQYLSTNLILIGIGAVSFSLVLGLAAILLWILPVRGKVKPDGT